MMKKSRIIAIAAVAVVALYGIITYNSLARSAEEVDSAWANVEAQYQRRSDLIPNLVTTVRGYANHERGTLTGVMAARLSATAVKIEDSNMTEEQLSNYTKAQNRIGLALGRLIAVAENYPDLKANQNFLELQAQLEGTENRIAVERQRFNESVKAYNKKIVSFPNNLLSSLFGFKKKVFFTSLQEAKSAPVVQF